MKKFFFYISIVVLFASCTSTKKTVQNPKNVPVEEIIELDMPEVNILPGSDDTITKQPVYRATYEVKNELLHTRLKVKFDFNKKYLIGDALISLKPKFYATNQLELDARGMDILKVRLEKNGSLQDLKYTYDNSKIFITLDKIYTRDETYKIAIEYIAKPDELEAGGSAAITSDKGLYFINPDGSEPFKPTQIWTQGETESSSVWFPTIDKPNMKHSQELYITVDNKYKTLSNGLLISSSQNGDGTRTDYWKQDLKHAPYLTMMAIGEFSITKDDWRGKEVSYYLEPAYEKYARNIFGNTPEMMEYFSKKVTGVDYVWDKYANVVVRDFVSGAMENTGAVIYFDALQQTDREQLDNNIETIIAHELFHHWFGDLVTCESWSNLPLNESFANYSEYLWVEYKYGKDHADYDNKGELNGYMNESKNKQEPLIRFEYESKEDMFDAHSYNKGGRVLHMLRNYLGDDAFFAGMKNYLTTNKFKTGELSQLRLAYEEVTGKDLNWFFTQWFLNSGHPIINYDYSYDEAKREAVVKATQKQSKKGKLLYTLPIAIDVYVNGKATRHQVMFNQSVQEFRFASDKPDFINADADKVLLCVKKENKTDQEFIAQYKYGPLYMDRYESLSELSKKVTENKEYNEILYKALVDKHFSLRKLAIEKLELNDEMALKAIPEIKRIAEKDAKSSVRNAAIKKLNEYGGVKYADVFKAALKDSSYAVVSTALKALNKIDNASTIVEARNMMNETSPMITSTLMQILSEQEVANPGDYTFFEDNFNRASGFQKFSMFNTLTKFALATKDNNIIEKAIQTLKKTYDTSSTFWIKSPAKNALGKIATYFKDAGNEEKSNQILEMTK